MTPATLLAAAAARFAMPHVDYLSIMPELILLGAALLILALSALVRRPLPHTASTWITVLASSGALVAAAVQWHQITLHGPKVMVANAIAEDGFSVLVTVLVASATFLSVLVADGWLRREGVKGPELHVLVLVSASGAVMMGAANDLIVVFLGLEIMSIALYVLAAHQHLQRQASGEAALKYFILGAFSSAVFVYGIALVYGATGTTDLPQIADYLSRNLVVSDGLLLAGIALLLVGFAFKIAAVPFHMWTPDVYQGSPSPVTGYMSAVAKAGGFAALLRVFVSSFGVLRTDWQPIVWGLAILTLVAGAVMALVQRDVKRMLAYSSINHAGFILLGLQAASAAGVSSSLYYLFVYGFLAIGSFAVVSVVGGRGDADHDLNAYRGLVRRNPLLAGAMVVLLVGQAGVPATTGFLAKLEVISASAGAHSYALAVVAMLTAAIAAFFYLRVVLVMFGPAAGEVSPGQPAPALVGVAAAPGADGEAFALPDALAAGTSADEDAAAEEAAVAGPRFEVPGTVAFAIAVCVGFTVLFGVWPAPVVDFAHRATLLFV